MSSFPDDLRELYFEFGRAAEMAQVMETEAGNLALLYASMFVDTSKITDEQREFIQSIVQGVNESTFGKLFREIQKLGEFDASLLATVKEALEKRNYLTHGFFRKHNFAIHSEDGRKAMLAEVREIQGSLSLGHAVLSGISGSLSQLHAKLFGLNKLSEQEGLALMKRGKQVDI
jgi:hypothetical protein